MQQWRRQYIYPGTLNVIIDGLSRGLTSHELGLDESQIIDDAAIKEFIMMCDPSKVLTDMRSHKSLA